MPKFATGRGSKFLLPRRSGAPCAPTSLLDSAARPRQPSRPTRPSTARAPGAPHQPTIAAWLTTPTRYPPNNRSRLPHDRTDCCHVACDLTARHGLRRKAASDVVVPGALAPRARHGLRRKAASDVVAPGALAPRARHARRDVDRHHGGPSAGSPVLPGQVTADASRGEEGRNSVEDQDRRHLVVPSGMDPRIPRLPKSNRGETAQLRKSPRRSELLDHSPPAWQTSTRAGARAAPAQSRYDRHRRHRVP
jgi:hypothetical protein